MKAQSRQHPSNQTDGGDDADDDVVVVCGGDGRMGQDGWGPTFLDEGS